MKRPGKTQGLRHVALFVPDLVVAEHFFVDLMGMTVEWRPDADNMGPIASGSTDHPCMVQTS